MHIKPETHKICGRHSGLKALKIIGMVSQQFATLTAAFTIHFAELKGMENQYEHFKIVYKLISFKSFKSFKKKSTVYKQLHMTTSIY